MNILISHKIIFFLLIIVGTNQAHAYIDPGTGSIILQAIIAAFAGIGVFYYSLKDKIKSFFGRNNKSDNANEPDESD